MARESWTDERLDDFKQHVDQRFDWVDARFDRVETRLESLTKAIVYGSIALSSAMLAGCVAIALQI